MSKHLTVVISDALDRHLRLLAAHTNTTKAEAALAAMTAGIPAWVTTSGDPTASAATVRAKGGSKP